MDKASKKGMEIYEKLEPTLVPHYPGQFIVINTDNAEYWIDSDMLKAVGEAKKKYPDKEFYIAKIDADEGAIADFK
jgi:kynurenine formamidase